MFVTLRRERKHEILPSFLRSSSGTRSFSSSSFNKIGVGNDDSGEVNMSLFLCSSPSTSNDGFMVEASFDGSFSFVVIWTVLAQLSGLIKSLKIFGRVKKNLVLDKVVMKLINLFSR